MPPSRDPVWDHFYSLKTDFREPAIDLELQARKNASYDNAWCKACVDHTLGQVEYSHWVPVGQCTQEYLDLLRRYRGEYFRRPRLGLVTLLIVSDESYNPNPRPT